MPTDQPVGGVRLPELFLLGSVAHGSIGKQSGTRGHAPIMVGAHKSLMQWTRQFCGEKMEEDLYRKQMESRETERERENTSPAAAAAAELQLLTLYCIIFDI